jgi:hypothetical protein
MAKIPLNTTNEFVRRRHEGRDMGDDELCHDMHAALDKGVVGSCVGMKIVRNSQKTPKSFPFSYLFDRSEMEIEKLESEYRIGIVGHLKTIKSKQKICQ